MHQAAVSHGGEHRGKRKFVAEYAGFEIAIGDGDGAAGAESYVTKGAAIFGERLFGFGAAIEIIEDGAREAALRQAAQIFDVHHLG